jgi:hypothetical protein
MTTAHSLWIAFSVPSSSRMSLMSNTTPPSNSDEAKLFDVKASNSAAKIMAECQQPLLV